MHFSWRAILVFAAAVMAVCVPAQTGSAQSPQAQGGPRHTVADVQFMQGMIAHHGQALVMAAMAPTHGASTHVSLFCKKVIVSQRDEIVLMQTWLRERGEAVPDPTDAHSAMPEMTMDDHAILMPGMLTSAQLTELDRARGATFDRLFLAFMIRHHRGALTMVASLFGAPGAGQTPEVFGYATGVDADQRAEIGRMERMLTTSSSRTSR